MDTPKEDAEKQPEESEEERQQRLRDAREQQFAVDEEVATTDWTGP